MKGSGRADFLADSGGLRPARPVVLTNCSNNDGPWQFPEKHTRPYAEGTAGLAR